MSADAQNDRAPEYNTLCQELLEAKRYVFERPLAITALAAIGLQVYDKPPHIVLPFAVSLLTLFNFWFTINRLQSASRIVAYIQLVLEPSADYRSSGWETSLRQYRIWLKSKTKRDAKKYVDGRLERDAAPPALMYYPVYYFHAALMTFAIVSAMELINIEPVLWARGLNVAAVGAGAISIIFFLRWRPSRMRFSIERNRVIWQAVFRPATSPALGGERTPRTALRQPRA